MKNNYIIITTIICIILLIIVYSQYRYSSLLYVKCDTNNTNYLCRNVINKKDAANILGEVDDRLKLLKSHLTNITSNSNLLKRLSRFNTSHIRESSRDNSATSYSINKGEIMVLCIRSKENEVELKDINTIMFVAIHEFSHTISDSIGHTRDYWSNFKYMLNESIKLKIYEEQDYSIEPEKYCGIKINSSPIFLNSINSTWT